QPIEEAIASLGGNAPASPPKATPKLAPVPVVTGGDLRSRLHAALTETKQVHLADAVTHSEVSESPNEIVFTAPKMYQLCLKRPELEATVKKLLGRPVKLTIRVGEVAAAAPVAAPVLNDDASSRALEHPEVKRFQEMFPEAQVRAVRNLKET